MENYVAGNIELIRIMKKDKKVLENLISLYLHDLSEFADDLKIDENGLFEYEGLELYYTSDELMAYFITLDHEIIGLVFINTGKYAPQGVDYSINEFFILKSYRRKGLSKLAINEFMKNHHGTYEIIQFENNITAVNFWHKYLKSEGITYKETKEFSDGFEVYQQVFHI